MGASPRSRTRRPSTCFRSASSAWRVRGRAARRCRARPGERRRRRECLRARLDAALRPHRVSRRAVARWRSSRSATRFAALLPDGPVHARGLACTSGAFSPALRSDCSPRRSAASTRRRSTRCATRGRRSGSRLRAWSSRARSAFCSRSRCPRVARAHAWRERQGSPHPPASRDGWSSCFCAARSRRALGARASPIVALLWLWTAALCGGAGWA